MKLSRYYFAAFLCICLIQSSCKKPKDTHKKTTCSSVLHAYTASSMSWPAGTTYPCSHGTVDLATGIITSAGSFSNCLVFTNKAAYNSADKCYYAFSTKYLGGYSCALDKIDATGATTTYSAPVDTFVYSSLIYNEANKKMYCIKSGTLAELTTGTSSFSASTIAAPVYPFATGSLSSSTASITIDNSTGDMYFITSGTPQHIEKYHPGSSSTTVIGTCPTGFGVVGMRFNKNDNMLYALKYNADTVTTDLIKIDPSTGTSTSIANIGKIINVDFISTALDPCSNRYIISTGALGSTGTSLYQLDMTGAIVKHDITPTFYQGLEFAY